MTETDRIRALRELARQDYQAYLQTEHWFTIRHAALGRGRFSCALCNSHKDLQVHHRCYDHLGEEWDSDTIVLCAECHQKHHFGENAEIKREMTPDECAWFENQIATTIAIPALNRSDLKQSLSAIEWSAVLWFLTKIETIRQGDVYTKVSDGTQQIRYSWYSVESIAMKGSVWHDAGYGLMQEESCLWLEDEDLRRRAIQLAT